MAHVMAIVSKAAFTELEARHGPLGPGTILPLDGYHSAHKGIEPVAGGGALHLVTARGDALWVVAVLRNPSFDGVKWTSEPNATPIRDVTGLIPQLRFANGRGLTAAPGRLGMALQTPRTLADADVVLFLGAAEAPSPGGAYHAAVVATLGGTGAKKAEKAAKTAARPTPTRAEPAPWRDALADAAVWRAFTEAARVAILDELVAELGSDWAAGTVRAGADGLATVVHRPSGTELIVVPGGRFAMGYTVDDALAVVRAAPLDEAPEIAWDLARARPPVAVAVAPFLFGRALVQPESLNVSAGTPDVATALSSLGWRLPTEAEWEWVAREGGRVRFVGVPPEKHPLKPSIVPPAEEENGWGARGLLNVENACDGAARMGHTWWQSEVEVVALHAASRMPGTAGTPRLCRDLPGAVAGGADVRWADTVTDTLATLSVSGKDRERAIVAVEVTGASPGPDLAALGEALLADVGAFDARILGRVLAAVTEVPADAWTGLIAHKDPKVRAAAAVALSRTEGGTDALVRALKAEKKPEALASMALAVATRGRGDVLTPLLTHEDVVVRAAAAIGGALVAGPDRLDPAAAVALATATTLAREPGVVWRQGDLAGWAKELLEPTRPEVRELAARTLARGDAAAVRTAMAMGFGEGEERAALLEPETLTPLQREILAQSLDVDPQRVRFSDFGVPNARRDRRVWLGLEPPSGVDTVVDTPDGRMPLYRFLLAGAAAARESDGWAAHWQRVADVLGAQPPRLQLEVFLDDRYDARVPDDAFPDLASTARALDPAEIRPFIESFLGRTRRARVAWVATLAPGEWLPERLWPDDLGELCALLPGLPPERREAIVLERTAPLVAPGNRRVPRAVPLAMARHVAHVPTPAVVRRLLQLAVLDHDVARVRERLATVMANPDVAAVVARFDALGELDGGVKADRDRVLGDW